MGPKKTEQLVHRLVCGEYCDPEEGETMHVIKVKFKNDKTVIVFYCVPCGNMSHDLMRQLIRQRVYQYFNLGVRYAQVAWHAYHNNKEKWYEKEKYRFYFLQ